ncbi:N-formylglutamate amidohydrolase [Roseobacter sinensis]|uniref:N-formylglutamate amidohydrolase n=1 Tax=Roseobacter sinensis TaxID=2931391 RepID=A0ABT3BB59_9RHOB|nr:N-formylglutamate amidohydrolase [Roseobacter sp. WL0113]MCV3270790.1 N-formylglutamate amidohydrolase [Roseobacter sp. WL0113]
MSDQRRGIQDDEAVQVIHAAGRSGVVLICEHASHHIPAALDHLGLTEDMRLGHAAWDPGALGVARGLSAALDAPLVAGGVSRLVYDCNRPPKAPSAILEQSEGRDIPGNIGLSHKDRTTRVAQYYLPFEAAVRETMTAAQARVLVTVHSFTPVFMGQRRVVEIGVLHDEDRRLADAMLACSGAHTTFRVERNAPYGPADGVTHTLQLHGIGRGIPNVMLEVRNDLIATPQTQAATARMLAGWITDSLSAVEIAA